MSLLSTIPAHPAQAPAGLDRLASGKRTWWLALTGLCIVLLVPLFVVDVPPLLDYPNHLARAFVLASLPQDTILGRLYAPHWSIIPNLALDIITPPLIKILPVYVAGRLLIAIAVLLPVLGTVACNTALGGRWWSLGVGLYAYNCCLLYGFLNFLISIGVALLLAASWFRWREAHPSRAILLAVVGAPVLFACHLMGLLFFAILVGSAELSRLYRLRGRNLVRSVIQRGVVLLLIFALPTILYGVSALQQLGGDAEFEGPVTKAIQAVTTFYNYSMPLDGLTAIVAIWLPLRSVVARTGTFPAPAGLAVIVIAVAYVAAPGAWKGTYVLDLRFAIMLGFMLFAGFVPNAWPPAMRRGAAAVLVVLFVARMALLTTVWADHRTDLADLRHVLHPVQPGQAVYVAEVSARERPAYWAANPHWRALSNGVRVDEHLGALALIERRAYWPFEFDIPSQQPIETREPYRALAAQLGNVPNWGATTTANVCGFDYVLLLEADAEPDLPPERFRLLVRSGFAALYAITKCKGDT
jgi:hypothetical protein